MIMVADDGKRTIIHKSHHGIDRPFRIGAIADDIAEADQPLGAPRTRGIKAGAERLPVGVDIGKDGRTFPPRSSSRLCLRVS
jgi:hypothetical protein